MLNFVYKPKPKKYSLHNEHIWLFQMATKEGTEYQRQQSRYENYKKGRK
jgi:hypothetical protein|tara:strand:+ start:335 stop:481 length:147 start_codon:yes stop_codon:yes gene_type:complete